MCIDVFLNRSLHELFDLVYLNQNVNTRRFKVEIYYLVKGTIDRHQWKNCYDQTIKSDIKQYEEIRKLTVSQREYYTVEYFLDC